MAGCASCGKNAKRVNAVSAQGTNLKQAIPEGDRVLVKYIGGKYWHKITSPNGAIFPLGFTNYGYGKFGDELIIHKGDLVPKDGSYSKFEKINIVEEPEPDIVPLQNDEPDTVPLQTEEPVSAFSKLKK